MKASEIRALSDSEVRQKIEDTEGELFNLRFQSRTGRIDNPARIHVLRKDIARCQTILGERSREARTAAAAPPSPDKPVAVKEDAA